MGVINFLSLPRDLLQEEKSMAVLFVMKCVCHSRPQRRVLWIGLEFLPSTNIGVDGYCRQSLWPAVHLSVCLSVCQCVCPLVHSEWPLCSNSLRISAISLKCGGMMHSTMEQIAMKYGHARPIFPCSTELSMIGFFDQVWSWPAEGDVILCMSCYLLELQFF